MYVLLRQLEQLRRSIALPAPRARGSLALRHVDAGSCNGCEHELNAVASPYYDLQQYGLNVVASPRHADVLGVAAELAGPLEALVPVDIRIPGCPPSPERIAAHLIAAMRAPTSLSGETAAT